MVGWEFGDSWFILFGLRMIPKRPNGFNYDCMGA